MNVAQNPGGPLVTRAEFEQARADASVLVRGPGFVPRRAAQLEAYDATEEERAQTAAAVRAMRIANQQRMAANSNVADLLSSEITLPAADATVLPDIGINEPLVRAQFAVDAQDVLRQRAQEAVDTLNTGVAELTAEQRMARAQFAVDAQQALRQRAQEAVDAPQLALNRAQQAVNTLDDDQQLRQQYAERAQLDAQAQNQAEYQDSLQAADDVATRMDARARAERAMDDQELREQMQARRRSDLRYSPYTRSQRQEALQRADEASQRVAERNAVMIETQRRQMQDQLDLQRTAFGGVRAPSVPNLGVQNKPIDRSAQRASALERRRQPNRLAFEDALAQAEAAADPPSYDAVMRAPSKRVQQKSRFSPYDRLQRSRRPARVAFEDALAQAEAAADSQPATDDFEAALQQAEAAVNTPLDAAATDPVYYTTFQEALRRGEELANTPLDAAATESFDEFGDASDSGNDDFRNIAKRGYRTPKQRMRPGRSRRDIQTQKRSEVQARRRAIVVGSLQNQEAAQEHTTDEGVPDPAATAFDARTEGSTGPVAAETPVAEPPEAVNLETLRQNYNAYMAMRGENMSLEPEPERAPDETVAPSADRTEPDARDEAPALRRAPPEPPAPIRRTTQGEDMDISEDDAQTGTLTLGEDQLGPEGDQTRAAGAQSADVPPRQPGGMRNQWGVTAYPGTGMQYANVTRLDPTEGPAPVLRQEIIEMRRRAQSEFIDERLAPVEAISEAFQPPIPGVAPYYYGSYTSPFMG